MALDDSAVRGLSVRYAEAVDLRDAAQLVDLFTDEARLVVEDESPGAMRPQHVLSGAAAIGGIVDELGRYRKTFHLLGQSSYRFDGVSATGQVYCLAHHYMTESDEDLVMYIRYQDRYQRSSVAEVDWRISERIVRIQWTDRLAISSRPTERTEPS